MVEQPNCFHASTNGPTPVQAECGLASRSIPFHSSRGRPRLWFKAAGSPGALEAGRNTGELTYRVDERPRRELVLALF